MSKSLDPPGQGRHFDEPDLGPNCLQRLSAEDTSRQRVNRGPKYNLEYVNIVMGYVHFCPLKCFILQVLTFIRILVHRDVGLVCGFTSQSTANGHVETIS